MDFLQQIRWRPGIGDPSFMGWVTVVAYAFTAITAALAARKASRDSGFTAGSRRMWFLVALLLGLLCINKQLNIQSLFTDIGRVVARSFGQYEGRREFQKWIVVAVMAFSLLASAVLTVKFRRTWKSHLLLGAGLVFLLTFLIVRAISWNRVEMFLDYSVAGVRMNWILELGGIFMIWLAAYRDYRNPLRRD